MKKINRKRDFMIKHNNHFHGSDLEKIEQIYHIKKEDIISFSANINPLGVSEELRKTLAEKIDAITTYPDREYTSLRKSIGNYVNTDYNHIIVGNGSTELISLFMEMIQPKNAVIIGPTYSEYEREISLGGGSSIYYPLREEDNFKLDITSLEKELKAEVDLLVICNPNNPTSSAIKTTDMRRILDLCKERDIFVMVDATYVEFADYMETITGIPLTKYYSNLLILRGVSKFFAAPGLRLGYAICGNIDLLKEVNKKKNPWTINSLAVIAGETMFSDEEYIAQTKSLISSERKRVCNILYECKNIKVFPPAANFVLVKILKKDITAEDLFENAIKKGLMIRDCSTFPFLDQKYIRFCFMSPKQNDALLKVLLESLN